MAEVLVGIVLVATAALVGVGLYLTFRGFMAVDRAPVEAKPKHLKGNPHDAAMTAQLKHFFAGKSCAVCSQPIVPMHGDIRPGLRHAKTHAVIAWPEIPAANLSTTLDTHLPICSNCLLSEMFRKEHPELIIDRQRTIQNASQ